MRTFLNQWFETLVGFPDVDSTAASTGRAAFLRALRRHRGPHRLSSRWGWKNPRNMWLIPFYVSVFPKLKFVHLLRDGRDMALSGNNFLLEMHGDHLLGPGFRDRPLSAQLALWRIGNNRAADSGAEYLGESYLRLRYEDLCLNSAETVLELIGFLDAPEDKAASTARAIKPSAGIGRWRAEGHNEVLDPDPEIRGALERFGYASG